MNILVTNDDSVNATQLLPLIRWCQKLGNVTTVVPKLEQSGKSHSIELHQPFEIKEVSLAPDITVWTVDSSPADCVRFAYHGLKQPWDLVISGINKGFNVGFDIMYSGTAGAVFEAASHGIPAIALSTRPDYYDRAVEHLDAVWEFFQRHKLLEMGKLYNVNIPPEPKGFRITRQGGDFYADDFVRVEGDLFKAQGKFLYQDQQDLTLDTDCVMHGYISVMPLALLRSDSYVYDRLQQQVLSL